MGGILGHAANVDGKMRKPHKFSVLWSEVFNAASDMRLVSKSQAILWADRSRLIILVQEAETFNMCSL